MNTRGEFRKVLWAGLRAALEGYSKATIGIECCGQIVDGGGS